MITANSWLLLLFSLPTNRNTERVAVWRRLKKMGAVQIKTSTYLLPDEPAQYEQFQWLAKQIRDYGGDSTLVRAHEIEGLTKERVIAIFNDARAKDYGELRKSLQSFIARQKKMDAEEAGSELERLTRRFREVRAVDFFDSPRGHDVAMLLRRAEGPKQSRQLETLDVKQYQGKTWLTRPRPEIDRVGSAWLIADLLIANRNLFSRRPPTRFPTLFHSTCLTPSSRITGITAPSKRSPRGLRFRTNL